MIRNTSPSQKVALALVLRLTANLTRRKSGTNRKESVKGNKKEIEQKEIP